MTKDASEREYEAYTGRLYDRIRGLTGERARLDRLRALVREFRENPDAIMTSANVVAFLAPEGSLRELDKEGEEESLAGPMHPVIVQLAIDELERLYADRAWKERVGASDVDVILKRAHAACLCVLPIDDTLEDVRRKMDAGQEWGRPFANSPAESVVPASVRRAEWQAKAIGFAAKFPDWGWEKIAKSAGVARSTLYLTTNREFFAELRAVRERAQPRRARRHRARGRDARTGELNVVDALDEETDE